MNGTGKTRDTVGYQLDTDTYARLRSIEKSLYGDGTHLTPDKRRDLANALNVALSQFMPINKEFTS